MTSRGAAAAPGALIGRAILLGALSALALPPFYLLPIVLIAVPGLLRLIEAAPSRRRAFWLGYAFGFAHHVVGIYWITEAIIIRAAEYWWLVPFAVPLLAGALAVFIAAPCLLAWHAATTGRRLLVLGGGWVLSDLARQFVATGFPWNLWGSMLELPGRLGDILIQPGAWIGIHGMTLAVILLAGLPLMGWRTRTAGAMAAAVWAAFGIWRLALPLPVAPGLVAVVVQGNVPEGLKWDRGTADAIFDRYLDLSRRGLQAVPSGRRVLVWPETASPFLIGEDAGAREAVARVTGPTVPAIIGSVRFAGRVPYNSLFVLDPPPSVAAIYDKWHLVPFGEYQPSWLPGVDLVDGSFGFGSGPRTLSVPGLPPFGPLICYEAVFSGQIVDKHDRPQWLVNITNDAWFGNSSGPRQHLAAARMRSVEEGLPLVRAANTGISAAFDPRGHELGRLGLDRTGFDTFLVAAALPPTFYSRYGLWVPLALSIICVAAGFVPRLRRV